MSGLLGGLNRILWSYVLPFYMISAGVILSRKSGFVQMRFKKILSLTLSEGKNKKSGSQSVFKSFAVSLGGAAGTGNIVGVSVAVFTGGAGALFWMWVAAFFGMAVKYAEIFLGVTRVRERERRGRRIEGPMAYIVSVSPFLSRVYAFFGAVASLVLGNIIQVKAVCSSLNASFGADPRVVALFLAAFAGVFIFMGTGRVINSLGHIVPFVSLFYIVGAVCLILLNVKALPSVLFKIFSEAFFPRSVSGGLCGTALSAAIRSGMAKGVFSNEAGMGTAVLAHTYSPDGSAEEHAYWGVLEVFFDTLLMCTLTGLCILSVSPSGGADLLLQNAFSITFGGPGEIAVSVSLLLFAFATLLSYSFYGERFSSFLYGSWSVKPYRFIFVLCILFSAFFSSSSMWELSDFSNAVMLIINVFAVLFYSRSIFGEKSCQSPKKKSHKSLKPLVITEKR